MLSGDTARCKHEGFVEELFGEFPMMSCCPATDIALTKKRGNKDPGICDDLFATGEIQRHGNVEPMPDPSEPALFSPACQKLRGVATLNSESLGRDINRDDFLGGTEHGSKACAGSR